MLRIEVRNEDLTMSRFALSPLWELTHALRLLASPPRMSRCSAPGWPAPVTGTGRWPARRTSA